jgi:hypothetical protein
MVQRKPKPQPDFVHLSTLGQPHRSERRERRSPLSILLRVCGFSEAGRIFSEVTCTVNISRSGCCVQLHTKPLVQGTLALQIIPRENPLQIINRQLLYEAVWSRRQGDSWNVGLAALGQEDLLNAAFSEETA